MTEDRVVSILEEKCKELRGTIEGIKKEVWGYKKEFPFAVEPEQASEIINNIVLTYRHLEDARMRLGKVMQHIQGGVSIFDREK